MRLKIQVTHLEEFVDAKLTSIMIKSELKLEEGFAPEEFEALPSLDELLSSQPNPSSEKALAHLRPDHGDRRCERRSGRRGDHTRCAVCRPRTSHVRRRDQ